MLGTALRVTCVICVEQGTALHRLEFLTEQDYDLLWVNGQSNSDTEGLSGVEVILSGPPTPKRRRRGGASVPTLLQRSNFLMTFYLWRTVWSTFSENPAAQSGWIHQVPDRWPCEAAYGCSLCSSILARGAHERYAAAARVRAGSLESSEPFEVSADGQRSRVDRHGTMFVDENGVTLRGWIDNEDLKLRGPDARVQLAVGNVKGPDDFNGYGYFHVRLYCTGLGFQANIAEEYVLLSALLHVFADLKRTRDQKLSSGLMSGLAITGLMLLMFMTIHLFQLRFADTEQYFLRHQPLSIGGQVDVLLD